MSEALELSPLKRNEAQEFVRLHHRHHKPPVGDIYRIGLVRGEEVVGCIMVGRPVSRHLDDGTTVEVTRCCVIDGVKNGCSKLYGAAWRAAKALGYRRMITYTLPEEGGASLWAAGWKVVHQTTDERGWSCPTRPRVDTHPLQAKFRWEAV